MGNSLTLTSQQKKRIRNLIANDIGSLLSVPMTMMGLPSGGMRYDSGQSIDALLDKMEHKQKQTSALMEELKLQRCGRMFDKEELFRFSYVPFVIAELVWDYADTVIIQAQVLRNTATIKLSREIRKARAEFVSLRRPYMIGDARERQIENGYLFEEGVGHITKQMLSNIRIDIQKEYPELEEDSRNLLVAVYQCHILSKALLRYMAKQKTATEKRVGHAIGDIMPKAYYVMDKLIPEFIGDKPCSEDFMKLKNQYIETLATQIGLVVLNDTSEPETK